MPTRHIPSPPAAKEVNQPYSIHSIKITDVAGTPPAAPTTAATSIPAMKTRSDVAVKDKVMDMSQGK